MELVYAELEAGWSMFKTGVIHIPVRVKIDRQMVSVSGVIRGGIHIEQRDRAVTSVCGNLDVGRHTSVVRDLLMMITKCASAMNIAEGRPSLLILTSLMFGFAQALSNYLQLSSLPTEIVSAFPFLFTVVILLIANTAKLISGRNRRKKIAEDYMNRLQSASGN